MLGGDFSAYQKPRCVEGKKEWGGLDPSTYTRSQLFLFLRKHSSIEIVDMHTIPLSGITVQLQYANMIKGTRHKMSCGN